MSVLLRRRPWALCTARPPAVLVPVTPPAWLPSRVLQPAPLDAMPCLAMPCHAISLSRLHGSTLARLLAALLPSLPRPEMVVGWYHSHPGFGCWLSGVDVNTQQSFEALNQRAVAGEPAGRVPIGAARGGGRAGRARPPPLAGCERPAARCVPTAPPAWLASRCLMLPHLLVPPWPLTWPHVPPPCCRSGGGPHTVGQGQGGD